MMTIRMHMKTRMCIFIRSGSVNEAKGIRLDIICSTEVQVIRVCSSTLWEIRIDSHRTSTVVAQLYMK